MMYSPQAAQIIMKSQEQEYSAIIQCARLRGELRHAHEDQSASLLKRVVNQLRSNRWL